MNSNWKERKCIIRSEGRNVLQGKAMCGKEGGHDHKCAVWRGRQGGGCEWWRRVASAHIPTGFSLPIDLSWTTWGCHDASPSSATQSRKYLCTRNIVCRYAGVTKITFQLDMRIVAKTLHPAAQDILKFDNILSSLHHRNNHLQSAFVDSAIFFPP